MCFPWGDDSIHAQADRATDVVYPHSRKSVSMEFHDAKLKNYILDRWSIKWKASGFFSFWPKRLMVRGLESNWQLGTSGTSWWLALIIFKNFINYCQYQIPTQWAAKQEQIGAVVDVLDSRAAILRSLHRLEMWVNTALDNFNKDKRKSCNNHTE